MLNKYGNFFPYIKGSIGPELWEDKPILQLFVLCLNADNTGQS
jgi:hypothetical protein